MEYKTNNIHSTLHEQKNNLVFTVKLCFNKYFQGKSIKYLTRYFSQNFVLFFSRKAYITRLWIWHDILNKHQLILIVCSICKTHWRQSSIYQY